MAIPNIVPRNNNDGETLGTAQKHWSNVFAEDVTVGNKSLASVIDSVDALSTSVGSLSTSVTELSDGKVDKASPQNADGKDLALAENVLALSGGTMTGAILTNDNVGIRRNGSTGFLQFGFQPVANGVRINLFGKDYADDTTLANGFQIVNANGTVFLVGKNDGTLTWGGKEVERVSASGTRYIRYESGLQICWGAEDAKASTATQFYWDITVPVAYKDTTYSIVCTNQADITATATGSCQYSAGPKSTTVFRVIGTARWGYRWIAIGRWK